MHERAQFSGASEFMDRLGGYFGAHEAEDPIDDYVDEDDTDMDAPPSPVGQDERRMQVRAYNHWASLLGERNYPDVTDLEPDSLDDFGPYSVLLDFSDGIDDPVVQYVGAELSEECGHDELIVRLSDVPSRSVLSRITDHYMQILANQAPIGFEAEFMNERGVTVLYRGILLPYSSDNETIDFIYGVINWKEMADAATADELLREIGQSLGDYDEVDEEADGVEAALETAETLTAGDDDDQAQHGDILDLSNAEMVAADDDGGMPMPSFGVEAPMSDDVANEAGTEAVARAPRGVDALGNPIGAHPGQDEPDYGDPDSYDDYDSGIRTAADYGLPDFDEEPETDDVDDLVDPLEDEEASSSLISLVSRGERTKKAVDLSLADPTPSIADDEPTITFPMPEAYSPPPAEDEEEVEPAFDLHELAPVQPTDIDESDPVVAESAEAREEVAPENAPDTVDEPLPAIVVDPQDAPEGLYDCLAAAREQAQAAQNTEDRSRKALYAAVALAYDFSLETQDDPAGFDELLQDNGLTVQDRAPMTPVVKLVFGADYDKTRLTEYAAVLSHAHRLKVERGALASFLHAAEGGLKGVVQAERRARKEEQGKAVEDHNSVKPALAKKLRELAPLSLEDLAGDGPEFALVMVRRTPTGQVVVLGELPEDVPALERSARKLLDS
ncbi:PAS domain-containing protein [Qipengyuania marincola]|uniref:PAS domain-containing protein n=1 Tax=Qipengyuania sp. XHP0207 TaxID=3038078 RepID=UPI0040684286